MKKLTEEEFLNSSCRGVTSVLSIILGNKYENSNIPEYTLKAAAERGTAVHKYIEEYQGWLVDSSTDEPHVDMEYNIYEDMFKKFLSERVEIVEVLATEKRMLNKKMNMKGVLDAVWKVKNKDDGREYMCLIDFKTSSNLDLWTTACQLQLYYLLLSNGTKSERQLAKQIEELRCLSITKTGYRWFKFTIDKKLGQSLLTIWQRYLSAH